MHGALNSLSPLRRPAELELTSHPSPSPTTGSRRPLALHRPWLIRARVRQAQRKARQRCVTLQLVLLFPQPTAADPGPPRPSSPLPPSAAPVTPLVYFAPQDKQTASIRARSRSSRAWASSRASTRRVRAWCVRRPPPLPRPPVLTWALLKQSEINFWNPDPETGRLIRTGKMCVPLSLLDRE